MTRRQHVASVGWAVAVAMVFAWGLSSSAWGAEETRARTAAQGTHAKKKAAKTYARLPSYFGKIVDETQREKVYAIQNEYGPKVAELKAQLKALLDERNKKIEAVLTKEQIKALTILKKAAQARRKKARDEGSSTPKPAESTS